MLPQPVSDRDAMEMAITEMEKCAGETKVGAVLVVKGKVVGAAGKGQRHAERTAIEMAQAAGVKVRGGTLYTTLEPCVDLAEGQEIASCARFLVEAGIKRVLIGSYDPNPLVRRQGWRHLNAEKVKVEDFSDDLHQRIVVLNEKFSEGFIRRIGPNGGGKVRHKDGATYEVQFSADDPRVARLKWGFRGEGKKSVYAYGDVAQVPYVNSFTDIGNPNACGPFGRYMTLNEGEFGVFRTEVAFVLVKVTEIAAGPDVYFVEFKFSVRLRA